MSVSISDFWRLAVESRLLAPGDCQQLEANFAGVKGASSQSNAATLGEWLVASGVLTRFQIQTLLAGRAGPFYYGDYFAYDRIRSKEGRLAGLLRAMHVPTRHPVLLYAISGAAAKDPQWWAVAAQQVAWACSVGHPFVSQCYQLLDLGKHKVVAIEDLLGDPAPGVERAEGSADNTLAARFTDGNRLAPGDACRLAYQLGLGLARLHQLGQVHSSIRPDNVWLQPDGTCKLLQTPLAPEPAMGPGPIDWNAPDPNGQALLSADYAAPELAQLGRPPDMLSDVYALGATLYRMLSGWAPFPGGDVASKLSRHASESLASLQQFDVPEQLAQMVGFLLAKDPAGRYQSAAQVAEALAYFVDPAVQSYMPQPAATAAVFDQWLESQPRLPGMAPGAIPTASSLAAYSAAQYAAAQDAAAQYAAQAAMQSYAPPVAAAAPPPQPPAEHAPSFYESLQPSAPSFDPTSFAANEPSHAEQPAYPQWGAAAAGGAAVVESMPSVGVAAAPSPGGLNLDAVLDAPPKPARAKSRRMSASAAPKAKKMSPLVLAGLGGGLAVVLVVVGVIVSKALSGGSSDDGSQVVLNTPETIKGTPDKNKGKVNPDSTPGKTTDPPKGDSGTRPADNVPVKPPPAATGGPDKPPVQSVADDGVSLWASPTAGNPLPLDYVASGRS